MLNTWKPNRNAEKSKTNKNSTKKRPTRIRWDLVPILQPPGTLTNLSKSPTKPHFIIRFWQSTSITFTYTEDTMIIKNKKHLKKNTYKKKDN